MGYTHYWYREQSYGQETFNKIVSDFKQLVPLFKVLDIKLADGNGEGEPIINDREVCFNGSHYCGHKKNPEISIPWPTANPKPGVAVQSQQTLAGYWFAGVTLNQRTCDGTCDYETFWFPREMEGFKPQIELDNHFRDGKWIYENPNHLGKDYEFTKTAYRPYDLAVCAFLIIAKHYLKDKLVVESDGTIPQWQDAMDLVFDAYGYGKDFEISQGWSDQKPAQEVSTPQPKKEFYTSSGWKGEQYEKTKDLPLKEIAQRIKKEALAKHPEIKLSVVTDHYSMGCSIDVRVKEVPFKLLDPEKTREERTYRFTEKAQSLLEEIRKIGNQYQRSDCDGMIDYYSVHFHYDVEYDWHLLHAEYEAIQKTEVA